MHIAQLSSASDRVLGTILRRQAEDIPDAIYLKSGGEQYSFGRVNALANAYAAGFRDLEVRAGDTVATFMAGSPEQVFTTYGVNKLGAIWVPTNTDYRKEWLRESLEDSRARVLVVDAALLERVAELGSRLPFEWVVVNGASDIVLDGVHRADLRGFAQLPAVEPDIEVAHSDTAAVLWTSGTTGRPKGVMQSHSAWVRGSESSIRSFDVREGDVLFNCLPMYNSAAWIAAVYPALLAGVPLGLDDHFSVSTFWDRTRFYSATHMFTLGAMHIFLWQAPPRPDDRDNPVRVASTIPMPDRLMEPFKERFGIERIAQGYGQSEVFTVLLRIDDGTRRWKTNSAGVPPAGMEVRLHDENDVEVPVGEVGEFCVRPAEPYRIFNGYFNNPEATAAAFRNLWYHTGDLGRKDEDGEFFFFDRKKDYIRYKGRNVSSFAVEAAVNAHPAVAQSAAYGVQSAELEMEAEIKVDVVLNPGATLRPEELATFVNETAPYFFVPRYIEFLDALPLTPTGKVRKFALRERGIGDKVWDRVAAGFVVKR
ncbi:MAG: crotonobetaine/carnitine-CoA ligase [Deltaproteobacteria bacterium]|nr:crotonobetaine/carnitine-CoA ligase [Deltaproteobacteria bacterium]